MKLIEINTLTKGEKTEILKLWNSEYPRELVFNSISDFDDYLNSVSIKSHLILVDSENKILGWYCDFIRDNETWFVLILSSKIHGHGYGSKILKLKQQSEIELNGWVIEKDSYKKANGLGYISPMSFYIKNGFHRVTETKLSTDKISAVKIRWVNV